MPLKNDVEKVWTGWLVDDLGGQEDSFEQALLDALQARNIPKCSVKNGKVNMWWRRDSRYIDLTTTLDGTVVTTIHIQEYGTSLWVGRAIESSNQWNYYKRMAAAAFLVTVDRCIRETILGMVAESAIHDVEDLART